ncbi:MAG: hypothetical protein PUC50_05900, partial [Bacteroidales bacterium]|nr:hypothetical protein [Bacteroidales bacterium]
AKIKCEFSDAEVNTDNILLDAEFHNIPDSTLFIKPETIRKEIQEAFFDAATVLTDFSIKDTVKLDKPYTYLYINESGKVMAVIDDKGKIKTEETTISATNLKENTLIQGKNGEELVLTKKGQVMGKTEFNATGGNSVLLKEYHRKSDSIAQWQINFISAKEQQVYAFDHIGSGNHGIFSGADYYPQVGSYDFRYKSVECGKNDKVIVEFGSYPQADSVVFKDKYGVTYPISSKDNVLSFTGVSKADTNYIYAYRGDQKIGKLFLNTYQQKTYQVVLISVNEAKLPNTNDLENYLNKVYYQCAVSFKIETRKLQVSGIENFTHGGTKVAGSVWNASQKTVLEAFGEKYEDNTAYLFFIPKAETGGVAGYMPRYYPYGFIYPGAAPRTIAHELGHGIAGLEHPFPESQVSGSTQNLMDYRDGEELWHFQWDMLQDPARKIFKWWQNEQDAEDSWSDYFVNVMLFIERFRQAYVNSEKFQWQLFDGDYSTKNLKLWNDKKYAVVGFEVVSIFDEIEIKKKDYKQKGDRFEYVYPNFKIYSTGDITDYLFPDQNQYQFQMSNLRQGIVDNLNNRNLIIQLLSYLPESEYVNFTFDQRQSILKVLANGSLTEPIGFFVIPELINGEKVAINMIKYVPDSQIDDLYNLLKGPANLYEPLNSAINDAFLVGNDNNTEFNNIVSKMAKKCSDNTKLIAKIREYAKNGDRLLDQQYEDLLRCVESCPDNLLPNLFDCMFGYKVDNATNKVEQGLFVSLSDTPGRHAVSNTLCKKLKQYYGGDLSKMPLVKRIEYLKFLGLNGPSKLTIATKNPYQGELIYALFNSTPQKDLPEVIKLLDYNGRYLYSGLRDRSGERYPDFVKTVYSRIKSTYSNAVIPIEKRKEYLLYYSKQDEIYEQEEFVTLDLLNTTPDNDLSSLLNYMKDNKLYTKFTDRIDNIGGADNYDEYYKIIKTKWKKCYPRKNEGEFVVETDQAFLKWYEKEWNLHRALFHWDVIIGADAAFGIIGSHESLSFGFGIDSHLNIGLFGNANIFAYLFKEGIQFNKITELRDKSFDAALTDYKNWNFLSGINVHAGISINYDYFAPDVRALFGIGTTYSYSITYKGLDFSFLINCDSEGKFIGFGYGTGVSKDEWKGLPIQRVSELNRGLIFNLTDLLNLKYTLDDKQISEFASLDIENGNLVIKSRKGTFKTNLSVQESKDKSYYISTNANKSYKNE